MSSESIDTTDTATSTPLASVPVNSIRLSPPLRYHPSYSCRHLTVTFPQSVAVLSTKSDASVEWPVTYQPQQQQQQQQQSSSTRTNDDDDDDEGNKADDNNADAQNMIADDDLNDPLGIADRLAEPILAVEQVPHHWVIDDNGDSNTTTNIVKSSLEGSSISDPTKNNLFIVVSSNKSEIIKFDPGFEGGSGRVISRIRGRHFDRQKQSAPAPSSSSSSRHHHHDILDLFWMPKASILVVHSSTELELLSCGDATISLCAVSLLVSPTDDLAKLSNQSSSPQQQQQHHLFFPTNIGSSSTSTSTNNNTLTQSATYYTNMIAGYFGKTASGTNLDDQQQQQQNQQNHQETSSQPSQQQLPSIRLWPIVSGHVQILSSTLTDFLNIRVAAPLIDPSAPHVCRCVSIILPIDKDHIKHNIPFNTEEEKLQNIASYVHNDNHSLVFPLLMRVRDDDDDDDKDGDHDRQTKNTDKTSFSQQQQKMLFPIIHSRINPFVVSHQQQQHSSSSSSSSTTITTTSTQDVIAHESSHKPIAICDWTDPDRLYVGTRNGTCVHVLCEKEIATSMAEAEKRNKTLKNSSSTKDLMTSVVGGSGGIVGDATKHVASSVGRWLMNRSQQQQQQEQEPQQLQQQEQIHQEQGSENNKNNNNTNFKNVSNTSTESFASIASASYSPTTNNNSPSNNNKKTSIINNHLINSPLVMKFLPYSKYRRCVVDSTGNMLFSICVEKKKSHQKQQQRHQHRKEEGNNNNNNTNDTTKIIHSVVTGGQHSVHFFDDIDDDDEEQGDDENEQQQNGHHQQQASLPNDGSSNGNNNNTTSSSLFTATSSFFNLNNLQHLWEKAASFFTSYKWCQELPFAASSTVGAASASATSSSAAVTGGEKMSNQNQNHDASSTTSNNKNNGSIIHRKAPSVVAFVPDSDFIVTLSSDLQSVAFMDRRQKGKIVEVKHLF